eukprot:TRINITY_DN786_c0_g1_i4.p1 TRINITY_DN786_c0_g1~~TRINITY_DN786_c0_g1_i4.p1  ORF type:complete len:811 (+),score=227.65 TRINITY_DN786_c0_g1_i4:64-2496(+)
MSSSRSSHGKRLSTTERDSSLRDKHKEKGRDSREVRGDSDRKKPKPENRERSRSRSKDSNRNRTEKARPRNGEPESPAENRNGSETKENSRKKRLREDFDGNDETENGMPSKRLKPDKDKPTEPIALDDLIKQKQQEQLSQKPVFLTKKQRQQLALERRQQQVAAIRKHQEEERKMREEFLKDGSSQRNDRSRRDREREREREREKEREREREERKKRRMSREEERETREQQKELKQIKEQYLGVKKKKKKVVKPSEKFKFVFEWDLSEDTSRDTNPLYNNRTELRPLFGRGFLGGIDKREQIKQYREILTKKEREARRLKDKEATKEIQKEKDKWEKELRRLNKKADTGKHWSKKTLAEMTDRDWRIFREDYNITTKGGGIPLPIRDWEESHLPSWLLDAVKEAKYKKPTPIQMQAIPIGLQGRDILGVAETGSGKTAAFVLPMLVYIKKLPKMNSKNASDGPYALILAPTRELALQIESECSRFAKYAGIRCVSLVGGQAIEEQAQALRGGCEIIIATPGRLNDCLESRYIVLNQCNYVVLDEADRMIDMGFEPQILSILDAMPKEKQKSEDEAQAEQQEKDHKNIYRTTIMFSATMPPSVERLAKRYLRRPAYVYIGEVGQAVDRIKQVVEFVKSESDKKRRIESLLLDGPAPPIIVFMNQKKGCDAISKYLCKLGYRATTLHSGRTQEQREWALEEFRAGRIDVLVATDVAGRGLDVKGITHVINYDMAKNIEDYTHRIGRTGRAGMEGLATSFITNEDAEIFFDLKNMLQKTGNPVPPELANHPASQYKAGTVQQTRRDTIIFAQ